MLCSHFRADQADRNGFSKLGTQTVKNLGMRRGMEVFHTSCKVTLVGSKYASEVDQIVRAAAFKSRQGSAIYSRLFGAQWRCGDWKINLREAH